MIGADPKKDKGSTFFVRPDLGAATVGPLFKAVREGQYEKAELLIAYGADPNKVEYNGEEKLSALEYAKQLKDQKMIDILTKS